MPTTFCLINQKGGCGKSSTCFHLAGAFAISGYRTLLVDMDPQGSLSQGFLGPICVESLRLEETVASLFDESCFFSNSTGLIRNSGFQGIDLCPANQFLAEFNTPSPETTGMSQHALGKFLEQSASDYDFVLIDCPPNLYRCSWTAMLASDYVIIPVPPEDFGTQGLRAVHQCIKQARRLNPKLRRLGHLITRCDRRLLIHRSYEKNLREVYHNLVLESVIPEASAFKVSLACRTPAPIYAPKTNAAIQTNSLFQEILLRVGSEASKQKVA